MPKFKVALIQSPVLPDRRKQIEKILHKIREAAGQGAKVVCLSELSLDPYFPSEGKKGHFNLAEEIPGSLTAVFSSAAKEHQIVLILSLFEKTSSGEYFNTAVVLDEKGRLLGQYRKIHIPHDPGYFERFYFSAGDLGIPVFKTSYGKISVLVCWDQWFPEASRMAALKGAEFIFYPTAIGHLKGDISGTGPAQLDSWVTVQRAQAIMNGCFVAAVNRVGEESKIRFWGNSFVSDPFGRILIRGSGEKEEILIAEYDLKEIAEVRREWRFLKDRQPEKIR